MQMLWFTNWAEIFTKRLNSQRNVKEFTKRACENFRRAVLCIANMENCFGQQKILLLLTNGKKAFSWTLPMRVIITMPPYIISTLKRKYGACYTVRYLSTWKVLQKEAQ